MGDTMNTPARIAIPKLGLTQANRPIDFFVHYAEELDMAPEYQRGDVWGRTRQQNLWFSILGGVPIPSIILNSRIETDFDGPTQYSYGVIDGKQRITAILAFVHDRLTLPGDWFSLTGDVHYSDLDQPVQRRLANTPLATSEGRLPSLDAERQVFELVNYGGVPQGSSDDDLL